MVGLILVRVSGACEETQSGDIDSLMPTVNAYKGVTLRHQLRVAYSARVKSVAHGDGAISVGQLEACNQYKSVDSDFDRVDRSRERVAVHLAVELR